MYGREIPDETIGAQAAAVRRWLDADISDAAVRRNVALGMQAPGALERAMGSAFEAVDWAGRVENMLAENFAPQRSADSVNPQDSEVAQRSREAAVGHRNEAAPAGEQTGEHAAAREAAATERAKPVGDTASTRRVVSVALLRAS